MSRSEYLVSFSHIYNIEVQIFKFEFLFFLFKKIGGLGVEASENFCVAGTRRQVVGGFRLRCESLTVRGVRVGGGGDNFKLEENRGRGGILV